MYKSVNALHTVSLRAHASVIFAASVTPGSCSVCGDGVNLQSLSWPSCVCTDDRQERNAGVNARTTQSQSSQRPRACMNMCEGYLQVGRQHMAASAGGDAHGETVITCARTQAKTNRTGEKWTSYRERPASGGPLESALGLGLSQVEVDSQ